MALTEEELREAASHRGMKLVKSRKRKAGIGDYGLFGLTDAAGKPLYGISDDRLTATADQIADFLRKGETSTWAELAKSTPARPKPTPPIASSPSRVKEDEPSDIRLRRRTSASAPAVRDAGRRGRSAEPDVVAKRGAEKSPRSVRAEPEPTAEPDLAIRTARATDADALRRLFASLGKKVALADTKRAIAAAAAREEPVLVADRGGVLACLTWHIVPTVERGATARITAIIVDEEQRRLGIGRALYEAAVAEFGKRKVQCVEAMSAIEIVNANGFYRALGLKQASYRFVAGL